MSCDEQNQNKIQKVQLKYLKYGFFVIDDKYEAVKINLTYIKKAFLS